MPHAGLPLRSCVTLGDNIGAKDLAAHRRADGAIVLKHLLSFWRRWFLPWARLRIRASSSREISKNAAGLSICTITVWLGNRA
jgi:hypothetical protein